MSSKQQKPFWEAKVRGLGDDPRSRLILQAEDRESAREKARAIAVEAGLAQKPAIAWCKPLPADTKQLMTDDGTLYALVTHLEWQWKNTPASNRVGYMVVEFHVTNPAHDDRPSFGTLIFEKGPKGLQYEYIDERDYVHPHDSFVMLSTSMFEGQLFALMRAEARKRKVRVKL